MKCLSVSQPFADLIIRGRKTIELRTWNTSFRGEFLVHAPLKIRTRDCARLNITGSLPTGAIVGKAVLYDVRRYGSPEAVRSDYDEHYAGTGFENRRFGFLLRSPKAFKEPIPYRGRLGFFEAEISYETTDSILAGIIEDEYRYRLVGHH